MLIRLWHSLCDALKINFGIYKKMLFWFAVCLILGIILGIITAADENVTIEEINKRLIDQNILHSAAVDTRLGSFVWERILSIFVPLLLLFALALLSDFTALCTFAYMVLHGYWLALSVWWTIEFYAMGSIFILAFYIVWLLIVTAVLIAGCIWVMKLAGPIRCLGFRAGCKTKEIITGVLVLLGIALALAILEHLVYWVFLGKLVFKIE